MKTSYEIEVISYDNGNEEVATPLELLRSFETLEEAEKYAHRYAKSMIGDPASVEVNILAVDENDEVTNVWCEATNLTREKYQELKSYLGQDFMEYPDFCAD